MDGAEPIHGMDCLIKKEKAGSLGLLAFVGFREKKDIPYLLWIQRIADRDKTYMFYVKLLPAIPVSINYNYRETMDPSGKNRRI